MPSASRPTDLPLQANLTLDAGTAHRARVLADALAPEAGDEVPRTSVELTREGSRVGVIVDAGDVSSLRAAVNAYLRWAHTSLDVADVATGAPEGASHHER